MPFKQKAGAISGFLAVIIVLVSGLPGSVQAKTETLSYLPRSPVRLVPPVVWGNGIKVLMLGGKDNFHDFQVCYRDIDGNTLRDIHASCHYTEDPADIAPQLKNIDVLLDASFWSKAPDAATRQAILDYLAAGKGLIFAHAALWQENWRDWPEKASLLEAATATHHVPQAPFDVKVIAPDNPIMKGLPATFPINDELYQPTIDPKGSPVDILATASVKGVAYPVVWIVHYKNARIVCITLGHNETVHHDDYYKILIKNAVLWAAGKSDASANSSSTDATPPAGWKSLFNGHDLSGWTYQSPPADQNRNPWSASNGMIVGNATGPEMKGHGHLWLTTNREYSDFLLKLKFQVPREHKGDSGVDLRCRYDNAHSIMDGTKIDIFSGDLWRTGMLYDDTRGSNRFLYPDLPPGNHGNASMTPPGFIFRFADEGDGWNEMEISAIGGKIKCTLNGVVTTDYDDAGKGILVDANHAPRHIGMKGHISLKIHAGDGVEIRFKDIWLKDLSARA